MLQGSSLLLTSLFSEVSSTHEICLSSNQPLGEGMGRGLSLARGMGRMEGEGSGEKALSI
jgi:hypothetical protein